MNINLKNIENFIKVFENKYNYITLLLFTEKLKDDLIKQYSISHIPMLQLFIGIILEYYKDHDILLDYSDNNTTDIIKYNILKKVGDYSFEKSIKLFDLVDFMFQVMKKILVKSKKGFDIWAEGKPLNFEQAISYDIDIYFYIVFINIFPEELKDILRKELNISSLEDNIIKKCNGIILKNNVVCNIMEKNVEKALYTQPIVLLSKFDDVVSEKSFDFSIKPKPYSLDRREGIAMLLKIISMLRGFSNRRQSKLM